jgi:hypothetical protein
MGGRHNGKISGTSPEFSCKGSAKSRQSSGTKDGVTAKIEISIPHKRSSSVQHTTTEFGVISMRLVQSQTVKAQCLCVSPTSIAINQ